MRRVTVDRQQLLDTLRENRERHINTFEEVLTAYKDEAIRQLDAYIERIRNGEVAKVFVALPEPKNYEEEYDRAIAMVEWEQNNDIELDETTFASWVLDDWVWKADFTSTNSLYTDK